MWKRSNLPAAPPRGPRAAGLTLIELLAALSILALVLTLAYGSFFQISGAANSLKGELSEQQELRMLLKLIADDLQSSRYLANFAARQATRPVNPGGIVARVRYVGRTEFSFVSFHAATEARFHRQRPPELDPGLHELGYGVQEDPANNTVNLVRREDYYLDSDMESGGVTVILARRLETFSLAFLLPPDAPGSTAERWEREWNSADRPEGARMPRAIRIGLGLMGKDGQPLRETLEVNLPDSLRVGS